MKLEGVVTDGALIAPKVEESTILNELEYQTVAAALKLARSQSREAQAVARAIRRGPDPTYAMRDSEQSRYPILRRFVDVVMEDLGSHVEEIQGMICLGNDDPVFLYEDKGTRR